MARKQRTDGELARGLRHLGYEYATAMGLAYLYASRGSAPKESSETPSTAHDNQIIDTALGEAFLGHVRALCEFFFKESPNREQRMWWKDFSASWTGQPEAQVLNDHYERLCSHLAHLSWDRLPPPSDGEVLESHPNWQIREIATDVEATMSTFVAAVSTENQDFGRILSPYLSVVPACESWERPGDLVWGTN